VKPVKVVLFIFLSISWIQSCADQIVSECTTSPAPPGLRSDLSSIQQYVFTPSCTNCHGASTPESGLNLSEGASYSNLVGAQSVESNLLRVESGNSAQSWLIKKLEGNGTSMMPPTGSLSRAVIDSIKIWIDSGALNN
jgi:hypothetical protein